MTTTTTTTTTTTKRGARSRPEAQKNAPVAVAERKAAAAAVEKAAAAKQYAAAKADEAVPSDARRVSSTWTDFHESFYIKMRRVYGEDADPCAIARAMRSASSSATPQTSAGLRSNKSSADSSREARIGDDDPGPI